MFWVKKTWWETFVWGEIKGGNWVIYETRVDRKNRNSKTGDGGCMWAERCVGVNKSVSVVIFSLLNKLNRTITFISTLSLLEMPIFTIHSCLITVCKTLLFCEKVFTPTEEGLSRRLGIGQRYKFPCQNSPKLNAWFNFAASSGSSDRSDSIKINRFCRKMLSF